MNHSLRPRSAALLPSLLFLALAPVLSAQAAVPGSLLRPDTRIDTANIDVLGLSSKQVDLNITAVDQFILGGPPGFPRYYYTYFYYPGAQSAKSIAATMAELQRAPSSPTQLKLVGNLPQFSYAPGYRRDWRAMVNSYGKDTIFDDRAGVISRDYNATLEAALAASGQKNVLLLDFEGLFDEIVASPASFGLSNVRDSACRANASGGAEEWWQAGCEFYVTPDADRTYLFNDSGLGLTPAGQEILAGYTTSLLEAPGQIAALADSTSATGRAQSQRVLARFTRPLNENASGTHAWADVRGDFQSSGSHRAYSGNDPALTVGIEWRGGNLAAGGFLGYGKQSMDYGSGRGGFEQSGKTLGAAIGWRSDATWVNALVSYTRSTYDIDRRILFGAATRAHRSSTDGRNLAFGVEAGYEFGDSAFRHGPAVGVLIQKIKLDGFTESDPTLVTSLAFPNQTLDSRVGSVGWQFRYELNSTVRPYARLDYEREFEGDSRELRVRVNSQPWMSGYTVPGQRRDRDYGAATLGTQLIGDRWSADIGATTTIGREDADVATAYATVSYRF